MNLHCFLQKCQTTQELIKFRSHLFIVIEQIHRKRHVWNFRRIHLWSGRNYKYVEQNAHIGQLAKVTDVELLHYIMPALSPSLKVIALEPSFLSFRPFKSFLIYSLPQPLPYQLIITRVEPQSSVTLIDFNISTYGKSIPYFFLMHCQQGERISEKKECLEKMFDIGRFCIYIILCIRTSCFYQAMEQNRILCKSGGSIIF